VKPDKPVCQLKATITNQDDRRAEGSADPTLNGGVTAVAGVRLTGNTCPEEDVVSDPPFGEKGRADRARSHRLLRKRAPYRLRQPRSRPDSRAAASSRARPVFRNGLAGVRFDLSRGSGDRQLIGWEHGRRRRASSGGVAVVHDLG
jgi:hypothetical protein